MVLWIGLPTVNRDLLPFVFHVELNGVDPITVSGAEDNKNRGFSLDYLQLLC